jgi:CheY-like chemotaxis protein
MTATGTSEPPPRLEEALARNAKLMRELDALGRLTRAVAHDVNNVLTLITYHSDQVLGRLVPGDPSRANLDGVKRAVEWGAMLTRRLLRQETVNAPPPAVDLNRVIRSLAPILSPLLGNRIELVTRLAPDLGPVAVAPGQLEQVIMNLAMNARDAMADGGRLSIETANVEGGAGGRQAPSSYAAVVVSDTGCGMDAPTQARLFEPYFTTKAPDRGTGLGLSVAYEIVRRHGGQIVVASAPGQGAVFSVYLPCAAPGAAAPEPAAPDHQGLETVLVVEHEREVRELVRDVLELHKYTVIEAPDVLEALALVERYEAAIDLAIVDVVAPGLGGEDFARRLHLARPGIRLLYLSGFLEGGDDPLLETRRPVLQKPFTVSALAARVREVLDA